MKKRLLSIILSATLIAGMILPANTVSAVELDEVSPASEITVEVEPEGEIETPESEEVTPEATPEEIAVEETLEAFEDAEAALDEEIPAPPEITPEMRGYEGGGEGWGELDSINDYPVGEEPNLKATSFPSYYETPNRPTLRRQSPYGTCWAHAATAISELSLIRKGKANSSIDLSEFHLSYFCFFTPTDPLGGTVGDTNDRKSKDGYGAYSGGYLHGGRVDEAARIFNTWCGIASESTLPYTKAGTMNPSDDLAYKDAYHLENFYVVGSGERDAMKDLITRYGGVAISYDDEDEYYNYYNNCYYNPEYTTGNHAVTIVGWDDSFSRYNFATDEDSSIPEGNGAWLIRNSWLSPEEGQRTYERYEYSHYGYFWMSYYDQSLLCDKYAYAFDMGDANNFDHNYQYDGCAWYDSLSSANTIKTANIFTTKANQGGETLKAISFIARNTNANYKVSIYKNPTSSTDPESGTLVTTQSGTTQYEGSYTVRLNDPVSLKYGDKFSVVVEISKNGYRVTAEMEYGRGTQGSHAEIGQSFINTGYGWTDTGFYYNENTRVKAYTVNGSSVPDIKINQKSFSIGGDVSLNYYIKIPDEIKNASGAYMMLNSNKTLLRNLSIVDGTLAVSYPVSPKDLNKSVSVYFCDSSGNKYNLVNSAGNAISGNIYTSSVSKTCEEIYNDSSKATSYRNLAGAMLDYGCYTRKYLGYNDGAIGYVKTASGLSGVTASTLSPYTKGISGSLPEGVVYTGSSLVLEGKTTVRHYFSGNVSGCTFYLDGATLLKGGAIKSKDGLTYVDVPGIAGPDFDKTHTLKVVGSGKTFELRYSTLSYAQTALSKSNSDALKNMVRALYNYNKACDNYF